MSGDQRQQIESVLLLVPYGGPSLFRFYGFYLSLCSTPTSDHDGNRLNFHVHLIVADMSVTVGLHSRTGSEKIRCIEVCRKNNMPETKGMLYVHVGMPRTGSTTIRHALKKLDPELRKRGILIPVAGRLPDFSHAKLVTLLSGEWYLEHVDSDSWLALEREIVAAGARTVVMSTAMFTAHGLFTRTPGQLAAQYVENLANACGLKVCILGYVRPQAELLESAYVRNPLRTFSAQPFSEYARSVLSGDLFDFNRIFEPWRERFGDNMKVATLGEAIRAGGPERHFLNQIGLPDLCPARSERINARYGARTVEMQRLVASALIESGLGLRSRLMPILRLGPIQSPHQPDPRFAPLTEEEMKSVTERFSACNARFARQYGIDPSAMRFEERTEVQARRPAWFGPDDLDEREHALVRAYVQTVSAEARSAENIDDRELV